MSRMFDRLMAHGFDVAPSLRPQRDWPKWAAAIDTQVRISLDQLRKALPIVVVADNVAQYFYAGTDQECWDLRVDFPCLAPPWEACWIEYKMPPKIVSCEMGVTPVTWQFGTHRAVLLETRSLEGIEPIPGMPWPSDAHWAQTANVFVELGKGDIFQVGIGIWNLRSDGTVTNPQNKWLHLIFGLQAAQDILGQQKAQKIGNALKDGFFWPTVYVGALAYSFINCRNTIVVDHAPDPQLEKVNRKRGKPAGVHYKTLEIQAVKKILSTEGNVQANGLMRALHICRGHFKDYRERGLFGRHKDLFWWDMHVRGTVQQGVIDKDYTLPYRTR